MTSRFPFTSFPRGWYVVGFSKDLAPGQLETVHYLGDDIVLFRTEAGEFAAVDKTCPHLGAHLGGGKVVGECVRCPFHDWAFDARGKCVDVPYAPKIPPKAKVRAWPVLEQDGLLMVFYGPSGEAPWTVPPLEQEGWTADRTIRWELRSHPQEVGENTVDCSHLGPVHHVTSTEVLSVEQNDHVMRVVLHLVATGAAIDMPEEINDVELDVSLHGLGQIISNTHVLNAGLRTRQRIHPTPIDGERIAIFAVANTVEMADPEYTREIDEIFWNAFIEDFARDFPIWENKTYLERPMLAGGDGPIGRYRRWAKQFYTAEETAVEPTARTQTAEAGLLDRLLRRVRGLTDSRAEEQEALDAHITDPPTAKKRAIRARAKSAGAGSFPSVDAYFDSLETRFDPKAAGDLDAVFQWVLTGDTGCKRFARVKAGSVELDEGTHGSPNITIEMSAEDYLLMINGELNGARAFSTGRGRLRGPVRLAMKMQKLFPLDR